MFGPSSLVLCGIPDSTARTLITQAMARPSQSTPVRVTSPSNGAAPFSSTASSPCTTSDLLAVLVRALCTCVRDGVGSQAVFSVACDGASSRMYCSDRRGYLSPPPPVSLGSSTYVTAQPAGFLIIVSLSRAPTGALDGTAVDTKHPIPSAGPHVGRPAVL